MKLLYYLQKPIIYNSFRTTTTTTTTQAQYSNKITLKTGFSGSRSEADEESLFLDMTLLHWVSRMEKGQFF
jgi:hypothetical protein